jgi:hypothetical protein
MGRSGHRLPPPLGFAAVAGLRLRASVLRIAGRRAHRLSPSATFGLEHHLYLIDGALELTLEGPVHRLNAGDCLRYKLMGASRFVATGPRAARYILVLR